MASQSPFSTKRLQIDKANATMVVATAVSVFVVIFSLFASRALWSQSAYQSRVISKKEKARDQLKKNIDVTSSKLVTAYKSFVGSTQNVLGGNPGGQGDNDGDNAKIILDALPSKYDFPALATSLEKLLAQNGLKTTSITGTDDELNQQKQSDNPDPQAVTIPFEIAVTGSYANVQTLTSVFERSIRPFQISTLSFSGTDSDLNMAVKAQTYYQPEKSLTIRTEVVK